MGAIHVQKVGPRPKRPLNAESYIPMRQSQAVSCTIRILRRRTGHENIAASGRLSWRPALQSAGQPRNGRHPCQRSAQGQRGPLTQSLASPLSKARGKASRSASSGAGGHGNIAVSGRAPGLPALLFAGQPRNRRHPCQRVSPRPKRPLNAKPGIAVPQGQGESVEVRILRRWRTRKHRCQWPGARRGTANENIAASDASPRPPALDDN